MRRDSTAAFFRRTAVCIATGLALSCGAQHTRSPESDVEVESFGYSTVEALVPAGLTDVLLTLDVYERNTGRNGQPDTHRLFSRQSLQVGNGVDRMLLPIVLPMLVPLYIKAELTATDATTSKPVTYRADSNVEALQPGSRRAVIVLRFELVGGDQLTGATVAFDFDNGSAEAPAEPFKLVQLEDHGVVYLAVLDVASGRTQPATIMLLRSQTDNVHAAYLQGADFGLRWLERSEVPRELPPGTYSFLFLGDVDLKKLGDKPKAIDLASPKSAALYYGQVTFSAGPTLAASAFFDLTTTENRSKAATFQAALCKLLDTVTEKIGASNRFLNEASACVRQITSLPPGWPTNPGTQAEPWRYTVTAIGADVYRLLNGPTGMAIDETTGVVSWTPTNSDVGDNMVRITVDPSFSGEIRDPRPDTQAFTIVVANVRPIFTSVPPLSASVGVEYRYDVNSNEDNEPGNKGQAPVAYSLLVKPNGMTIDRGTGVVTWTPTQIQVNENIGAGLVASFSATVQVDDKNGAANSTNTQSFTIEVGR